MGFQYMAAALVCFAAATAGAPPAPGLEVGEEVSAWEPFHIAGPHKGTRLCPVCRYVDAPVLLAFARDEAAAAELAPALERIAAARKRDRLKVILVALSGSDDRLEAVAKSAGVVEAMLVRPDPAQRERQFALYKIHSPMRNLILLYCDFVVRRKWTDLAVKDFERLRKAAVEFADGPPSSKKSKGVVR